MVAYTEVMCNRVIDILFLSIQNYLYVNLTNIKMVNNLRNEVHKALFRLNFDHCKKLLEVNKNIVDETKKCKDNISKLSSFLKEIEEAYNKIILLFQKKLNIIMRKIYVKILYNVLNPIKILFPFFHIVLYFLLKYIFYYSYIFIILIIILL